MHLPSLAYQGSASAPLVHTRERRNAELVGDVGEGNKPTEETAKPTVEEVICNKAEHSEANMSRHELLVVCTPENAQVQI
eukprot:m.101078 g.101078  ORF g.101078 m.101078 type:complete len:80 (-) comp13191_c0_seq2:8-247(-)